MAHPHAVDETGQKIQKEKMSPINKTVEKILDDVRRNGDRTLIRYTRKFDGHSPRSLEVSRAEVRAAFRKIDGRGLASLKLAAKRIKKFHELQRKQCGVSWQSHQGGITVGEEVRPLERIGIYVPGGLAAYPSTVLMNSIPARVAGVREIIMVSPWPKGQCSPYTLVAAHLAGVNRIFKIGGAQAIAALAYGTKNVPAVDKIVGPGNIYVATAKKQVFGIVGIDMVAGPSEVVIMADDGADPKAIASDLLSQAEHDPNAVAILLTPSQSLIRSVQASLRSLLKELPRGEILAKSLRRSRFLKTRDLEEACRKANELVPEHLEIQTRSPRNWVKKVRQAGAIFLGFRSPVAFGDYLAGPNHVLPTSRSARFSSPLGVQDFLKRSSVIEVSKDGLKSLGPHVMRLASLEGLAAHAKSVEVRLP